MAKDKSKSPEKKETKTPKTKKTPKQEKGGLGFAPVFALVVLAGAIFFGYQNRGLLNQISGAPASTTTEGGITYEDGVAVLTDANFQSVLDANEHVLVEFYATWCGHCKKLAPEYSKAAEILKDAGSKVVLAKVEATQNAELGKKFDVKGYPTLKWFQNGQDSEYNGGRTSAAIVNWINRKSGLVSTHLQTAQQIEKFQADNKVAVVSFTEATTGDNWTVYTNTAQDFDKVMFAHVTDASLAAQFKVQMGQVVVFKQFDEGKAVFSKQLTKENLIEFINQHRIPTSFEFDDAAIELVFQSKLATLMIFHDDSLESQDGRAIFDKLTTTHAGKGLSYSYSRPTDKSGHYAKLAEFLGTDLKKVPAFTIIDTKGAGIQKFHFTEEVTQANVQKFVEDFISGALAPALKSEEIPAENDGPVLTLVGKNFKQEVMETQRDVLVKFYAPWCGHCKSMAPAWQEAGQIVKTHGEGKTVLADIDSTANEVEGVEIQGFPTIKFFASNNKTPVDYTGPRETEGILKWLEENTTVGFKRPE